MAAAPEVGEAAPLLGSAEPGEREAARLDAINQAERDSEKTALPKSGSEALANAASSAAAKAVEAGEAPAAVAAQQHHTVVPAYPYNVSMSPFIPGSSSNRSDSYFEQHVPDDSNVQTRLPSICVDYLSHDWEEDDIWQSWKAMTKHKSEIANGVRLENASWRTWAKQRGKLKTISPETLNWSACYSLIWYQSLKIAHSIQAKRFGRDLAVRTSAYCCGSCTRSQSSESRGPPRSGNVAYLAKQWQQDRLKAQEAESFRQAHLETPITFRHSVCAEFGGSKSLRRVLEQ
jgi:hypothetical protein